MNDRAPQRSLSPAGQDLSPTGNGLEAHKTHFDLHLVSDATGETLSAVAHAAIVQFENIEPELHLWSLVRSPEQMRRVLSEIEAHPGLVMFTLVDHDLRDMLQNSCREWQLACVPVLDPVLGALSSFFGSKPRDLPGIQHVLDAEYFGRIDAIGFCLAHDDGQSLADLHDADIVLVGVSRTSKTPTAIYLANRGLRVGNVPIVPDCPLPPELENIEGPLVVGLTTNPERLVHIRRNRMVALRQDDETDYVRIETVKREVATARRLFSRHDWPVIDVTRRSIEETAAAILNLHTDSIDV
ncbi:MAG: pyruvate, water dikinase regulatory protein [Alphaproteobacteria bacterium]|jgi:hypothetical protein|nr:phosphoenolpyruvate synthase regulatory protein [Rhodospirillaceae bacterium]MDP6405303.1 pyruvate, water dikinase regulatory protein [Alphaproteobacteria bacterium]MDP6620686.1 pyruvate, water dikinase regulatory protein [Alphaproteobacteria bacterium]|tara:strand:- start:977 stop:1870 length:894 start_codon:yes stop_codon:yes gene_type:complete